MPDSHLTHTPSAVSKASFSLSLKALFIRWMTLFRRRCQNTSASSSQLAQTHKHAQKSGFRITLASDLFLNKHRVRGRKVSHFSLWALTHNWTVSKASKPSSEIYVHDKMLHSNGYPSHFNHLKAWKLITQPEVMWHFSPPLKSILMKVFKGQSGLTLLLSIRGKLW